MASKKIDRIDVIESALRHRFATDTGGATATRGILYQYLYALRLMRAVLDHKIDAYVCESGGDFVAWKLAEKGDTFRVTLFEVKSCANRSFRRRCKATIALLAPRVRKIVDLFPEADVNCCLVYSPVAADQKTSPNAFVAKLKLPSDWPSRVQLYAEPFVSLPLKNRDIYAELAFLEDWVPGIASLFKDVSNSKRFLETLLGITVPFHSLRCVTSFTAWARANVLTIGKLKQDSADVAKTLNDALAGFLHYTESRERERRSTSISELRREASRQLRLALPEFGPRGPTKRQLWRIGTGNAALRNVAATQILPRGEAGVASFGRVFRKSEQFAMAVDLRDLSALKDFLSLSTTTHRKRISLVRSFARAITRWTNSGLAVTPDLGSKATHWFVRDANSEQPSVVAGNLSGLDPFYSEHSLLDPRWVPCEPVAKVLRRLYYGVTSWRRIRNTAIYKAIWNDNVLEKLATYLEIRRFVRARELVSLLAKLFASETAEWPLFVSDIDPQFLRDCLQSGHQSPLHALCEAYPLAWQIDRGRDHDLIFYIRCELDRGSAQVQIGLLPSRGFTFKAYRYFRYGAERGISHLSRDQLTATEIKAPRTAVFVLLQNSDHLSDVVWQVFGIAAEEYVEWLSAQRLPDRRGVDDRIPRELVREENLHEIRLVRRNSLRQQDFPCRFSNCPAGVDLISEAGHRFESHLTHCGYTLDETTELFVTVRDDSQREFRGRILECVAQPDECVRIRVEPIEVSVLAEAGNGFFFLSDRGLDALVQSEQGLLRELFSSFEEGGGEFPPSRRAWEFARTLIPKFQSTVGTSTWLWDGRPKTVEQIERESEHDVAADVLRAFQSKHFCQILTGAPGTGKTRTVAEIAHRYLDANVDREFPPCHVLLVANTHWAVDNFVRTFIGDGNERHVVFRAVSPTRRFRLINEGVIDSVLLGQVEKNFGAAVAKCLPNTTGPVFPSGDTMGYRRLLERLASEFRESAQIAQRDPHRCLIPSHVKWRKSYGEAAADFEEPLKLCLQITEDQIDVLRRYESPNLPSGTASSKLTDLRIFAVDLVAVTVDGLLRLPDMAFDLVVFEEASQLTMMGLLKVLTKVMRAEAPGINLKVLLSGDPQQLPPFLQAPPACINDSKRARQLRKSYRETERGPTLFATLCQEGGPRSVALTTQHRMHPEIATLVNSIFYGAQSWRVRRSETSRHPAVWWIDTQEYGGGPEREIGGTSWLNPAEVAIVKMIADRHQSVPGRLIAVTPYSAQQRHLELVLPAKGSFRTIDGCQGIEAETVIVSFTRMISPFVLDYRRLNVGVSRARRRLYLVGNFLELVQAASHSDSARERAHLRGLVALFSEGGMFASRLIAARPDLTVPL